MNKITKVFAMIAVILMCIALSLFVIGICFFDENKLFETVVKISFLSFVLSSSVCFISWAIEVLKD